MKFKLFAISLLFYAYCPNLLGQTNNIKDFNSNDVIFYGTARGSSPKSIVELDNNWQLLLLLRHPYTISDLDSLKIKYTLSQLQLLEEWGLIKRNDNDTYETSMLIFDEQETGNLRKYSYSLSNKLAVQIKPEVLKLNSILKKINRERNVYSILFSYIIDGMVWDYLNKENLVNENKITPDKPFWNGEFWTLYPKRTFSCGTNSISDKGYAIKVNWSENTLPNMVPFVTRFDLQAKILDNLIEKGKVVDKDAIDVFGKFNFFDKSGNFTVPMIIENDSNDIYTTSRNISKSIVSFLKSEIKFKDLKAEYGFSNNSQALVILYHEMLWDILEILENDGVIIKPIAFKDPGVTKPEDISDLIIIVKK